MKEAVRVISACASRDSAVSSLRRMLRAHHVIRSGWKSLVGRLEDIAAEAFQEMRCMMFDDSGRDAWLQGVLKVDSLKQTLEFECSSSAVDSRRGRVRVCFGDSAHLGFKCITLKDGDRTGGSCYHVKIDVDSLSFLFRCSSLLDAANLQLCLLSYLLFRAMLSHHSQPPSTSSGSDYVRLRMKLLRSVRLLRMFKTSLAPPSQAPTLLSATKQSISRKVEGKALGMVSTILETPPSYSLSRVPDVCYSNGMAHRQSSGQDPQNVRPRSLSIDQHLLRCSASQPVTR
jgi:hypothetical protein